MIDEYDFSAAGTAPLSTKAMAMFFGTITFATAALATRTWLTGDSRAILAAFNPRSSPLDTSSFISVYILLHHFTVFGFILLFAYICEHHPPFPHADKSYDRDEFFFIIAIIFIISTYTVHRNDKKSTESLPNDKRNTNLGEKLQTISEGSATANKRDESIGGSDHLTFTSYTTATSTMNTVNTYVRAEETSAANDVLNRDQTEEWKGWMQVVFLLYHYFNATETYNSIRIMITCYVWMTGFGNFSFFYLKGDYSLVRVIQMLWRLNFLVVFLCLSQGTPYILYYICPLHTYFFLMVYFTMRIGKHLNYTKYGLRLKMGALAIGIFLIWDVDSGLFRMFHFPFFGTEPTLGATNGGLWEWYFRTSLDHWSTFFGMLFAANYPITSLFFRKLEAMSPFKRWLGKGSIGFSLLIVFAIWFVGPFSQEKFVYNATNAYFGFIPMLTYIYFRNITPTMRSHSLKVLHEIGKTTLETYLMQHHIWLTSNAKSLLTVFPGWPKVNMLIVTIIYFYVSRRLYRMTIFLRGMLLPDNRGKCIQSLLTIGGTILLFYGVAFVLHIFGFSSLSVIAIVSLICGMLLYQSIMDMTWHSYRSGARVHSDEFSIANSVFKAGKDFDADSSVARVSPPIIGALIILIIGIFWHGMALKGAGKIAPLQSSCDGFVNDGQWISVNGCNERNLGAAYRSNGVRSFATCDSSGGSQIWGWDSVSPSTHCRFERRTEKQLEKALSHRRVVFVGDSMTRNLYHSFSRQLGILEAGEYDATPGKKHEDIHRTIGRTGLDFVWAPLAADQLMRMKDLVVKTKQNDLTKYDLIVMGGGAWDRLHYFSTEQERDTHGETLTSLASEISTSTEYGTAVVWVTPTAINTPALNSQEKRDHMTEKDMDEMRERYESFGILSSSSFVVHGERFSRDRVLESYDGVHYPHYVYDAGAQILANALDWIFLDQNAVEPFTAPEPGRMANPFLGTMMLCLCFIGLVFFDGFLGFSYVSCIFVKGLLPSDLYLEAFTMLHAKMKLPPIQTSSSGSVATFMTSVSTHKTSDDVEATSRRGDVRQRSPVSKAQSDDDEIAALLGRQREEIEMKATI
jgi:hypothetical protein